MDLLPKSLGLDALGEISKGPARLVSLLTLAPLGARSPSDAVRLRGN